MYRWILPTFYSLNSFSLTLCYIMIKHVLVKKHLAQVEVFGEILAQHLETARLVDHTATEQARHARHTVDAEEVCVQVDLSMLRAKVHLQTSHAGRYNRHIEVNCLYLLVGTGEGLSTIIAWVWLVRSRHYTVFST